MNARGSRRAFRESELLRVVGDGLRAEVEQHPNPEEVDHVWIRMDIGRGDPFVVSVNTSSKRNRLAGFDSRVRIGIARGTWVTLPPRGVSEMASFDYAELERSANVFFEHCERQEIEELLLDRCRTACMLEAIGAPYASRRPGLHQIHSRRASCAVAEDIVGRDGALRFYFAEQRRTECLLFKFCGQV